MINDKILKLFNEVKKLPESSIYSGFGHCGYLSKLLSNKLKKLNIKIYFVKKNQIYVF